MLTSQKLEKQLQKAKSALNSFQTLNNPSPKTNNTLPIALFIIGLVGLISGLVIWKKKKKR